MMQKKRSSRELMQRKTRSKCCDVLGHFDEDCNVRLVTSFGFYLLYKDWFVFPYFLKFLSLWKFSFRSVFTSL